MKITLLHPSRGRVEQAETVIEKWLNKASGKHEIEYILSLDLSDENLPEYIANNKDKRGGLCRGVVCVNGNNNVVEATNKAAELATGDLLLYLSDDFKCPNNWDNLLFQVTEKKQLVFSEPWLIKVHDCLQIFEKDVLTIPIMSVGLYKMLGYFWNPLYYSMFVDQDLYHVCKNNNWLVFEKELEFEHLHYSVGKSKIDETYAKSSANWNQGLKVYTRRKQNNFPL